MLEILLQDDDFVAINKPSGLLSVPGKSEPDNLYHQVLAEFPNARVIHRLDMPTSGIILFALNHESQKHIGAQFENKKIHKQYVAIIEGNPSATAGEIHAPLICDWPNRPKQIVQWIYGKKAITKYKLITHCKQKNISRILLFPITGRSHQLRVHMQTIGHPILGDTFYASENTINKANRLLLHAEHICFFHPTTEQKIKLTSPPCF